MKKYFIQILLLLVFLPSIINAQWYVQPIDPNLNIYDVRFINKNTGWICGDNRIFKTTNSGTNWIEQSNPAQALLWQIHPVNENVVYAAGYCTILKTTNGGKNWIALRSGIPPCPGRNLTGLWFNDETTGWFCGLQIAMRTTDGGETFIDSMMLNEEIYDVHFKNDSIGVMCGFGITKRTTNSGLNWYNVPFPKYPASAFTYRETFIGDLGWTASLDNIVFKTTNYGVSWDSILQIQNGFNEGTYCIEFSSSMIGYVGCNFGKIYKTVDGGVNWNLLPTAQYGNTLYRSIFAYNDSILWAVGRGKILYTTTGGLVKANLAETNLPIEFQLYQNYPNPFNPITRIRFDVREKSRIKILVTDILGRIISLLVDDEFTTGSFETEFNSKTLSSGVYYYYSEINGKISEIKKMVLLR